MQTNIIIDRGDVLTCNTRCPRCGAPLIPDRDEGASCLMCGWYPGYHPIHPVPGPSLTGGRAKKGIPVFNVPSRKRS